MLVPQALLLRNRIARRRRKRPGARWNWPRSDERSIRIAVDVVAFLEEVE
jgi:hypothetical protein